MDLLDCDFKGDSYQPNRDGPRLAAHLGAVAEFMESGNWHTLRAISIACGAPEASVSARLRDLRRKGRTVERRYVAKGLYEYRVLTAIV